MRCHALLQGIFLTQGSIPGLSHCRQILHQLSHQGSPRILEWVAYPFCSRSSHPRIKPGSPALQADSLPTELSRKPTYIYICTYLYIDICLQLTCIYICSLSISISISVYTYTCIYICIFIYFYICICLHVYLHPYLYFYLYLAIVLSRYLWASQVAQE